MGFKLWIGAGIVVSVLVMALVWQAGPTLVNRVERRMRNLLDAEAVRESRSIALARQHLAAERSARLVIERMPTVESFDSDFSLLEHSLQAAAEMDGLYCEFGVASGRTINFIAERAPDRTIHGFDSFEGLPQDWRSGFRMWNCTKAGSMRRYRPLSSSIPGPFHSFTSTRISIPRQRRSWIYWALGLSRARFCSSTSTSTIRVGSRGSSVLSKSL